MSDQSFGKKIKGIRELSGLSQEAFAAELGVSKSKVQNIENGKQRTDHEFLRSLAVHFTIDVNELLLGNNEHSKVLEHLSETRAKGSPEIDASYQGHSALTDLSRLCLAIEAIEESLDAFDRTATPEIKAALITAAYQALEQEGEKAAAQIIRLVKAV